MEPPRIHAPEPPRAGANTATPTTPALAQRMDTHTLEGIVGVQTEVLIQYYLRWCDRKDSPTDLHPPRIIKPQTSLLYFPWVGGVSKAKGQRLYILRYLICRRNQDEDN